MNLTKYKEQSSTLSDITNHLNKCNSLFTPPLNSYVNIQDYAEKIIQSTVTIEAWCRNELTGLVACYLNNKETLRGYITNVSVLKEHQQKGIAKNLLEQTINKAKANGFKTLTLEVSVENKNAIQLYQRLGFILSKRVGNKYSMLKRLNENTDVMVSICCITFNHAKYIREAIEGFLMQKADFAFEVLIHDDASTDGTADIIREYEAKYPDIIKPIYQKENQYSKGISISATYNFPRAKGKYIALCEGDDYWTDPYKLQKQADFLENNPEYSMCFHNAIECYENKKKENKLFSNVEDKDYNGIDIYKKWIVPTASVVFKKNCITSTFYKNVSSNSNFIHGDIVLFLTCFHFGKLRGISDIMSVYRRHNQGITFSREKDLFYKYIKHNEDIPIYFGEEYLKVSKHRVLKMAIAGFLRSKMKEPHYFLIASKISFFHATFYLIKSITIYFKQKIAQVTG